jgi:transposase
MNKLPVFVGLDYHQDSIRLSVMDRQGHRLANRNCRNDWQAVAQAVAPLGTVARAAIESCTGAANLAQELIEQAGWPVDLAHPGFVSRMKQNPDKSDCADSDLLADLQRVGYLPKVWLAPAEIRELRRLVRYRQQLVNEKRNLKLRLTALLREHRLAGPARRWSLPWTHWLQTQAPLPEHSRWIADQHLQRLSQLKTQLRLTEKRLTQSTAQDPVIQKLLTFRGIGPATAWILRAEIGRFDRFKNGKQLSRFCGLSPCNASSGNRIADAGLVKAGNPLLRATLIEAAHRLALHDPRWNHLAKRLRQNGKPGSVVAAAVANRWMRWLFYQMQELQ